MGDGKSLSKANKCLSGIPNKSGTNVAQLVGTNCVHCHERINNELNSEFCSDCRHPRHLSCGQPSSGLIDTCPKCGAPFNAAEEAARQAAERAAAPRSLNLVETARHAGELFRLVKFLIGAVGFVALALALVFAPSLRSDPNRITPRDFLYSGVLAGAGVAFGAVGVWLYRNDRKRAVRRG